MVHLSNYLMLYLFILCSKKTFWFDLLIWHFNCDLQNFLDPVKNN